MFISYWRTRKREKERGGEEGGKEMKEKEEEWGRKGARETERKRNKEVSGRKARCGSAPAFYTHRFSLPQRPRFFYCPFLAAAPPPLFILTGNPMNFLLPGSPCGSAPAFYTAHLSLRQRPRFLY